MQKKYILSYSLKLLKSEATGRRDARKTSCVSEAAALATSDTYISQRASGSPLVAGAHGCESLFPTLGAGIHHPLLPQAGLQSLTFKNKTHTSSSSSPPPTPTQVPDLAPFCTRITTRRKQEVEQLLVAMCSIPAVLSLRSMGRDALLLLATGREVSTSVLVSHVDSVSLVQLSWYLGSMIASARLPPQPIGKIIQGAGAAAWCGLNSPRFASQQPPPLYPSADLSTAAPASASPSPADGVGGGGDGDGVGGAAIHRQQLTRTHPS